MNKTLIWGGMFLGSTLGSLLPLLWGGGLIAVSLWGGVGGIAGIWAGFKVGKGLE